MTFSNPLGHIVDAKLQRCSSREHCETWNARDRYDEIFIDSAELVVCIDFLRFTSRNVLTNGQNSLS